MIDSPLVLIALAMSAASGLAFAVSRRRRRHPPLPTAQDIATMSSFDLTRTLTQLQPNLPDYELVRRRLTLLVIDELERRQIPLHHG